jgi:hypothetical protein
MADCCGMFIELVKRTLVNAFGDTLSQNFLSARDLMTCARCVLEETHVQTETAAWHTRVSTQVK